MKNSRIGLRPSCLQNIRQLHGRAKNAAVLALALIASTYGSASPTTARPFLPNVAFSAAAAGQPPLPQLFNTWTSHGPFGGNVTNLAIAPSDPDTLYAWSEHDVFRSRDAGANWEHASRTVYSAAVVAIDPSNPATLFVKNNVYPGRASKSTDAGASWEAFGPPDTSVDALAIDPTNPKTFFTFDGQFRLNTSTDGGATWSRTGNGLPKHSRRGAPLPIVLAIAPADSKTLFAAHRARDVENRGVYRSTDGGVNWTKAGAGPFAELVITKLVVPASPNVLYAETSGGWFRSADAGTEWTALGLPNGSLIASLAIDPENAAIVYAGTGEGRVLRSDDGGISWSEPNVGFSTPPTMNLLVIDPGNTANLYLGTGSGLFKSTDRGALWQEANSGLGKNISFVAAPGTHSLIANTGWRGVFGSTDGGQSWARTGLPDHAYQFAVDPNHPNLIYACSTSDSLLYKSSDGGTTWSATATELPGGGVSSLAIDPGDSTHLYAGTYSDGLQKSTDGGVSWAQISENSGYLRNLTIGSSNSNMLYAVSDDWDYTVLLKSTDGGVNWSQPTDGFWGWISTLSVDPSNTDILYVGLSDGPVFKSTDGGATWQLSFNPGFKEGFYYNSLVIDPTNSDTLFAAYADGVFTSTDGGNTWSEFSYGLPDNLEILALSINPSGTSLHAGTNVGVFDYYFAPPCAEPLPSARQSFEAAGGDGSVTFTTAGDCIWTVDSRVDWIRVTSDRTGAGSGTMSYSVAPNESTAPRRGSIAIAGRVLTVSQTGVPVRINAATVSGKKLVVTGENFDPGAVILINGEEQRTKNEPQNPQTALIVKKAGKKITAGDKLQVRNPNGSLSQEFTFTGS